MAFERRPPYTSPTVNDATPLRLSVVIPAWNEALRLPATLERIAEHLGSSGSLWEVVVVSDGSDDGTDDIVTDLTAGGESRVRLLRHDRRRGKGAAVQTGVLAARGERILLTDADLATPIEDLDRLEVALDAGADVAISSRRLPGSEISRDQGVLRRSMGRIFPCIVRSLTGLAHADTQCGFKLFTAAAGRRLFERLADEGFAFDVEVLCRAREEDLRVVEIPVRWENRAGSKVSTIRDPGRMIAALFRLGTRSDLPRVVDRQLATAAGLGLVLVLVAALATGWAGRTPLVSGAVGAAVLAAVFATSWWAWGVTTAWLCALLTATVLAPVVVLAPAGHPLVILVLLPVLGVLGAVVGRLAHCALKQGRLQVPGAALLLVPLLLASGFAAGCLFGIEGNVSGTALWGLVASFLTLVAALAALRLGSAPLVVLALALAAAAALVTVYSSGFVPFLVGS